jgi:zona occludens toxin
MLHLITGVPGAGKTSFTLAEFLAIENRPKYATPVNGLDYAKHNIEKIDSLEEWVHLPEGSVIFCDEAQQFLRPKRKDAVSPEWVTEFETHRHRGLDFYCTTQHPMFIDIHFRRLVGEHVHYHRAYGSRLIAQRKWQRCIDDPNDYHATQEAEIKHLTLPKHIFKEYKSTTVDTHKFKVPRKLLIALSVLLLLAGTSAYLASGFLGKAADNIAKSKEDKQTQGQVSPVAGQNQPTGLYGASLANADDKPLTIQDFTPVLPTMPYTAPYYKDVAQPVTFPRFAGCMRSYHRALQKEVCRCVTQQGSSLSVPLDQCSLVVDGDGMPFDPFRSDQQSQPVLADSSQPSNPSNPVKSM